MKKIKFTLIGCGRISSKHFESIRRIDNAEIIACCDTIEKRAKTSAQEYNITKFYTDYQEMLNNEECDAVIICTPSGLHSEMGIQAAKHGFHVVTEKPMATTLESADRLIKACDQNKVQLFVVKQNRLNTTIQLLKKAIDKNRFGKIYMIHTNVFWQRPQDYYDLANWRGTWEFDGGAFMNQASHYVDAVQWLGGPVESVMAETATLARNIETEDTGSAILKFRNQIIGTINVTMLTYPKNFEGSITVLGENGTVKIGGIAINKIEKWEFEDYDDEDKFIAESNYTPPNVYGLGHLPYYKNVVDSLLGNTEPNTDGRGGRKSIEIIEAIYRSAKTGKRISLPLIRR
ncbi:MAG: Gfo/Idh/MocA family oxidoreductase [Candidatus Cloacimonadota bacterium]|nr:Gfo/Idh/MocA family oxidoreductase [Candidatus Cloacimonadota bacterium]